MQFIHEVNRVMLAILVGFVLVGAAAAYWAVTGPDTILLRDDNPRRVEAAARVQRGGLYSRDDVPLAYSIVGEDDLVTRMYPETAAYSALGYASLQYGVAGVEQAYNAQLQGETLTDASASVMDAILHRAPQGADVRVTVDMRLQQPIWSAMNGMRGAAVVIGVPSGEVLALVSLPTVDPNTLDANWDALRDDPANPFFNRALQAGYQPGGAMQIPLMMSALLDDQPLDPTLPDATTPVEINGVQLSCAVRLPPLDLSLRDAFAFACPQPFQLLAEALGLPPLQDTFTTLESLDVTLYPSVEESLVLVEVESTAEANDGESIVNNALGQGSITVSPLQMALMAAAIANEGNAPPPIIVTEIRSPDGEWQPTVLAQPSLPFTTANTARRLQDLMRYAVANGAAQNAGRPNIDIGGHASLAYTGETAVAWFVGFATFGGGEGAAVAIVLENSSDPGLAADIGGIALTAAQSATRE